MEPRMTRVGMSVDEADADDRCRGRLVLGVGVDSKVASTSSIRSMPHPRQNPSARQARKSTGRGQNGSLASELSPTKTRDLSVATVETVHRHRLPPRRRDDSSSRARPGRRTNQPVAPDSEIRRRHSSQDVSRPVPYPVFHRYRRRRGRSFGWLALVKHPASEAAPVS
jgi:hypothetical protein